MNIDNPKEKPPTGSLLYRYVHGFKKNRFPGDGFWYCKDQVLPWRVRYAGGGHYFSTMSEALRYAAGRGFITYDMMQRIRLNLEERGIAEE